MEITYEITPDMLGFSWRRVFTRGLITSVSVLLLGLVLSAIFHRHVFEMMSGVAIVSLISALLMRPMSRTKLRLTDDSIEELDGPVIRKDTIDRIEEYADGKCPGLQIVGKARPRWLRTYSVFVPAALPQYQDVRRVVQGWAMAQQSAAGVR